MKNPTSATRRKSPTRGSTRPNAPVLAAAKRRPTATANFQKLFSEMSIGCAVHKIICNRAGQPVDYVTLEVNGEYERLLEVPRAAVVGQRASHFLSPKELAGWLAIFGPVALTGKSTTFQNYSEGNDKYFEGSVFCPEPGKFASTFMDVTGRLRMEEALRQSEARYKTLVESLPQRIFLKSREYKFISVNEAFARAHHLHPADLVGKDDYDIHPKELADKYRADDKRIMGHGQPEEFEEQHLQDGRKIWVNTTKVPVRDQTGKINAIIGIFWDVTERKLEREQLQITNQQLTAALTELCQTQQQIIQQEQLRGLSQMASGIAHNFNNALSPIVGFTELLLKDPAKRADQGLLEKWLKNIHTCATDATTVVKQIREFGLQRLSNGEVFQTIDLNQLIQQTIDLTAPRWKDQTQAGGRTVQIETELLPVPTILGDEAAIRGVLTHLIFNALDFMPVGGKIRLDTTVDQESVRVRVIDTGTGMSTETRQRCFEPFFTTKGTHGTGLGLSMVHGVVQRHGGTAAVASELDQGTTFTIRFPIPHNPTPDTPPAGAAALTRALHILVVDDEPALCEVLKAELNSDGHLVETATNGIGALTRLMTGRFDLVITDLAMPKMNGEQLAAAVYKSIPNLPVILMTGFGDILKADGKMPPHIRALLCKPVTQISLREALIKVFPPQPKE